MKRKPLSLQTSTSHRPRSTSVVDCPLWHQHHSFARDKNSAIKSSTSERSFESLTTNLNQVFWEETSVFRASGRA